MCFHTVMVIIKINTLVVFASNLSGKLIITCFLAVAVAGVELLLLSHNSKHKIGILFFGRHLHRSAQNRLLIVCLCLFDVCKGDVISSTDCLNSNT